MEQIVEKVIKSKYPPKNKEMLWLDLSLTEPTLKHYIAGKWEPLTKSDFDYYTKPSNGIPATDLTEEVQTSLGKANTAYQKPSTGIPVEDIASNCIEIEWADLKDLRNNSQLKPGCFYRITDYVTTVNVNEIDNARSAGHPFDVIVLALDEKILSEDAMAIQHTGDTYFANSKLEAWELKYTINNVQWSLQKGTYMKSDYDGDSYGFKKLGTIVLGGTIYVLWQGDARFIADWTDYAVSESEEIGSTLYVYYGNPEEFSPDEEVGVIDTITVETNEGKGTIVYMKDEFNNECAYDFKNVQFKRYMTTDSVSGREGLNGLYMVADPNNVPKDLSVDDDTDFIWAFTFSSDNSGGEQTDYSLGGQDVYGNTIKEMGKGNLNNIVFFGTTNNNIFFGNTNYSMSFGNNNSNLSFGNNNNSMSFGNNNSDLLFGNFNENMTFGDFSNSMFFGNHNYNMSFGGSNNSISFGNSNYKISFKISTTSMSFGNNNNNLSFGDSNSRMSFENSNENISFGTYNENMSFGNNNYNMSFGNYCKNGIITNNVRYVDIAANTWNFQLLNDLEGTFSSRLTPSFVASKAYTQVACKNSSGQLVVYVPGDLA